MLLLLFALQQGPIPQPHLALTRANVDDVASGAITRGVTVVLRGGRIGPEPAPAGAEVLDVGGRYLGPGLIGAHTCRTPCW